MNFRIAAWFSSEASVPRVGSRWLDQFGATSSLRSEDRPSPYCNRRDAESLIADLSGGLAPVNRLAFRGAAENALATSWQWGPGLIHRTVVSIWRAYFHPPPEESCVTAWDRETTCE